MTPDLIAYFITADFALLILMYCLRSIFFPDGLENLEANESIGDRL